MVNNMEDRHNDNDDITEGLNNHSGNRFFTLRLKVFTVSVFLMGSGRLFHK